MIFRDALRTALVIAAVTVLAYPFLPHRPPPAPPRVVPAFGGYVATCCNRPLQPGEVRR